MNAYKLYEAVFDSANDYEKTIEHVQSYGNSAFDLDVSAEVAQKILDCREKFEKETEKNGEGQNNLFHFVEKPLSEIKL